jgi:hypothetical protein
MDLIKSYYPKNIKIPILKKDFTEQIRKHILSELSDKDFIQSELNDLLKTPFYYDILYKNIKINVIPADYVSLSILKKIIKRIYTLTQIYELKDAITIWLIPSLSKRVFPHSGTVIQAENINGGYTYIHNHTIYVYRFEEFPKVILHEVLHNSKLHISWSHEKLMELYKLLNIDTTLCEHSCKTRLQPEEALIELWALYYQIMFQAYEKKKHCMDLFNQELDWSLYQSKRLLNYHKIYYQNGWKEDTHAYSYIYLKTLFLYYWDDFSKIAMPYTDAKILKFIKNHLNKSYSLQNAIENSKDFNTESFRMTYFGDL